MISSTATVVRLEPLPGKYFLISLELILAPEAVRPGQFFMLGLPSRGDSWDPLLNRPLSVMDVAAGSRPGTAEMVFLVKQVGRGTRLLAELKPGEAVFANGPLGSAFPEPEPGQRLALVGGGVGIAPLFLAARQWQLRSDLVVFYGGRSLAELPLRGRLAELRLESLHLVSEDGAVGTRGLVSEPLAAFLSRHRVDRLYACGPPPMMAVVGQLAEASGVPAWVSLESRMGCGIGVCLGCAVPIRRGGETGMLRVCREGPVFPAAQVEWNQLT